MNKLKKYYHVTFKSRLSKILYEGIKARKKRIWTSKYGVRLGELGLIYAYTNWETAVRWAYKQAYDFDRETIIIEFKENPKHMIARRTPLATEKYEYEYVKLGDIEPEQITDVYDVDSKMHLRII